MKSAVRIVLSAAFFTVTTAVLPPVSSGQDFYDRRFSPLEVGNAWEYRIVSQVWEWGQLNPGPEVYQGYASVYVDSEREINGLRHLLLKEHVYSSAGHLERVHGCLLQLFSAGRIVYQDLPVRSGYCRPDEGHQHLYSFPSEQGNSPLEFFNPVESDTIIVGQDHVVVDMTVQQFMAGGWYTNGTPAPSRYLTFASGYGLVKYTYYDPPFNADGLLKTYSLQYARVGAVIIGQSVVVSRETESRVQGDGNVVGIPYPNPVRGILWLPINPPIHAAGHIEIIDILGRVLQSAHVPVGTSSYDLPLDVSRLSKGVYFVRVLNAERHYFRSFVKE